MIEDKDYILIDQYLANKLSDEDQQQFNRRLQEEKLLAEELAIFQSMNDHLNEKIDTAILTNHIQEISQQYRKKRIDYNKKMVLGILAAILLGIAALFVWKSFHPAKAIPPVAEHRSLSVEQGDETINLAQAIQAYNNGKYQLALPTFEQFLAKYPDDPEIKLAQGVSYLELNRLDKATEVFNALQAVQIYEHEANWYLALTALKQKQYNIARQYLLKIPTHSYYSKKASQTLKYIKEINNK